MAWTDADYQALLAARNSGVREVQYSDGSRAVYRSLTEMDRLLAEARDDLGLNGSAARTRMLRLNSSKGF